jgi:transposase-like protein
VDIIKLFETFDTQEQAVEYLEQVRWRGKAKCPYCDSEHVGHHRSRDRKGHRWQCLDCTRAFSVTVGTIFHRTHVPLRKWFLLIASVLDTTRSETAYKLAYYLGTRRATVSTMMQRLQSALDEDPEQAALLRRIVSAEELARRIPTQLTTAP